MLSQKILLRRGRYLMWIDQRNAATKETVLCGKCNGDGEVDSERYVFGEGVEIIKIPCTLCGGTGRRIKITTIQYLPFERGKTMITLAKDSIPMSRKDLDDFKEIINTSQEIMKSIKSLNRLDEGIIENYNNTVCLFKSKYPDDTTETLLEKILTYTAKGLL